jgi:hypothetical protein
MFLDHDKLQQVSSSKTSHGEKPVEQPSATGPDWWRERLGILEWNPGKLLLAISRDHQRWQRSGY